MNIDELDYELPESLIAQSPPARRTDSRLLVVSRSEGSISDCRFPDILSFLKPNDTLVLNETRVVPALLELHRKTGARIEGLFIRENKPGNWEVMLKGKGRIREGEYLEFPGSSDYEMLLQTSLGEGFWSVEVNADKPAITILETVGSTPLPPYIHRKEKIESQAVEDVQRYQTVYAENAGSVAAPTAGLHFTDELLGQAQEMGIHLAKVTLHVGPGTFSPIKADSLESHEMHSEWYQLDKETAQIINERRTAGGRTVAVGTTSVRTLESCADSDGRLLAKTGWTKLFCYPPYQLKSVDAMLTNFHLPKSTLLALVMCAMGKDLTRKTYHHAIAQEYRFFSYGDAMLIV